MSNFSSEPLAARMRPRTLEEVAGQAHILGPGKLLRRVIEADRLTNISSRKSPDRRTSSGPASSSAA